MIILRVVLFGVLLVLLHTIHTGGEIGPSHE